MAAVVCSSASAVVASQQRCSASPVLSTRRSVAAKVAGAKAFMRGSPVAIRRQGSVRSAPAFVVRAAAEDDASANAQALVEDLKSKWDAAENKSTIVLYAGFSIFALWLASAVVGAINSVPLLPKVMELIGLGYSGWFVYRYLLFKSSRKELLQDLDDLKSKIAGTPKN
eukprot:jgi/Chlat1/4914/Chrsp31S04835